MPSMYAPVSTALRDKLVAVQSDLAYLDGLDPEAITDADHFTPVYNGLSGLTDLVLNAYAEIPTTDDVYTTARFDVMNGSPVAVALADAVALLQGPLADLGGAPPAGSGRSYVDVMLACLRPLYATVMQSVADVYCSDVLDNAQTNPAAILDTATTLASALS